MAALLYLLDQGDSHWIKARERLMIYRYPLNNGWFSALQGNLTILQRGQTELLQEPVVLLGRIRNTFFYSR